MILVLADRHSVVGKVQSSHSAAGTAVHILSVWTETDFAKVFGDHSVHHRLHWWHPGYMWCSESSIELGKVVVTLQSQGPCKKNYKDAVIELGKSCLKITPYFGSPTSNRLSSVNYVASGHFQELICVSLLNWVTQQRNVTCGGG